MFFTRHTAQPRVFADLSKGLTVVSVDGFFKPIGMRGFDCLCDLYRGVGIALSIQINQKRNVIADRGVLRRVVQHGVDSDRPTPLGNKIGCACFKRSDTPLRGAPDISMNRNGAVVIAAQ